MIQGILKKIFGDKSAKDQKSYQPLIDKTHEFTAILESLTDDDLRAKTNYFQQIIKDGTKSIENEVVELNAKANNPATVIFDKEAIFEKIDNPINGELVAEIYSDVVEALFTWEPRFEVEQVIVQSIEKGKITIDLEGSFLKDGKKIVLENIEISSS